MSKRDEVKIRQRTNLYDLLDDGIENNSDLEALRKAREEAAAAPEPSIDREGMDDAPRPEAASLSTSFGARESASAPGRRHWAGALTGALSCAGGLWLLVAPATGLVFHDRIRYARPFIEQVSPLMSQVYGGALLVAGIAQLYFSLRQTRE
jgi:ferric-dicitrate binding protein FerR (iron transport regulator)